jgi:hypothetical protein
VLTAGHCGSITGAAVGTPAGWPAPLIDVRIGSNRSGQGEKVPVSRVIVEPDYRATSGHDITLLQLASNSTKAPAKVAGASEGSLWTAGAMETIAGWGTTSEGGDTPDTLQEAQVPITTDATCAAAYSDFDPGDDGLRRLSAGWHGHLPGRLRRPALRPHGGGRPEGRRRHELRRGLRAGRQARRVRARRRHPAARVDPLAGARGRGLIRMPASARG